MTEMELQSGTYPARPDEALLNQTALEQLGLSVGDTVTVALSDGRSKAYHVTGVLRDMGSLLKADVYGMVMNEDGFREIADENAIDGTTFRIQFKPGVNIRSAIREIRDDLNARGIRTKKGQPFRYSSFSALLKNRKYIGEYKYQDVVYSQRPPGDCSPRYFLSGYKPDWRRTSRPRQRQKHPTDIC